MQSDNVGNDRAEKLAACSCINVFGTMGFNTNHYNAGLQPPLEAGTARTLEAVSDQALVRRGLGQQGTGSTYFKTDPGFH